jgi:hypothetical protein
VLSILCALAAPGHADDGLVNMTWNGCAGPLDVTPAPADTLSLYLTVSGMNGGHKGYDVRFTYGNSAQQVPDAWRFDPNGCEGSSRVRQDVSLPGTCPAFYQAGTHNLQIRQVDFSPPSDPYATTLMRVLLASVYDPVTAVNPGETYLLERVRFDLSHAVPGSGSGPLACGGLEQMMAFTLTSATYLDLNGIELNFGRARNPLTVTVNTVVPARPTTWGSIKGQYR